ncbi:hypothetical protein EMPS_08471 [Entomortierella parvispora]|uniref:Uncharacterized protein n=1 Tax=Entomortierella parvispora TaxID=205924 RepID=A0A9P3HGX1_9FUNG|nr:hypothetical protein EMPS_08471 [Entomortierella parvispora]
MYRTVTAFVLATMLLAQMCSATTGELVISGHHYRDPKDCFIVQSSDALVLNHTPLQATAYSENDCKGTARAIAAGFEGKIQNIKSISIDQ